MLIVTSLSLFIIIIIYKNNLSFSLFVFSSFRINYTTFRLSPIQESMPFRTTPATKAWS